MRSGDPCERCVAGVMLAYKTRRLRSSEFSTRYLKCDRCGTTGQEVVAQAGQRRRPKSVTSLVTTAPEAAIPRGRMKPLDRHSKEPAMLLDVQRVAEQVGTDRATIFRWIRDGIMPAPIDVGGLVRWPAAVLERWAAEGCATSDPPTEARFVRLRVLCIEEDVVRDQLVVLPADESASDQPAGDEPVADEAAAEESAGETKKASKKSKKRKP